MLHSSVTQKDSTVNLDICLFPFDQITNLSLTSTSVFLSLECIHRWELGLKPEFLLGELQAAGTNTMQLHQRRFESDEVINAELHSFKRNVPSEHNPSRDNIALKCNLETINLYL